MGMASEDSEESVYGPGAVNKMKKAIAESNAVEVDSIPDVDSSANEGSATEGDSSEVCESCTDVKCPNHPSNCYEPAVDMAQEKMDSAVVG